MSHSTKQVPFITRILSDHNNSHRRILELGCGTSQYKDLFSGTYIGLDYTSSEYVKGLPRNVNVVADANDIPFCKNSFDLIFSISAFYQFGNQQNILNELFQTLTPNGILLLFDYNKRTQLKLAPKEGACRVGYSQWQLQNMAKKAGFKTKLIPRFKTNFNFLDEILRISEEFVGDWIILSAIKEA